MRGYSLLPAILLLAGVSLVAGTAVANDAAEAARIYREQHEAAILAEFRDFLSLPNVACIGGSWIAPPGLLRDKDFAAIGERAAAAASLTTTSGSESK